MLRQQKHNKLPLHVITREIRNSLHKCRAVLREVTRHQSAKGQQLPSEFYPVLQVLTQFPPLDSSTNSFSTASASSTSPFVVLPYVRGVSERILRALRNNNGVKVRGLQTFQYYALVFPETKGQTLWLAVQRCFCQGGLRWLQFPILYGQTDRALETRLKGHKRTVRDGDNNSKVAQHANQFVYSIDFDHATIVDGLVIFTRDFSWRPGIRRETGNNAEKEHIDIQDVFKSLRCPSLTTILVF